MANIETTNPATIQRGSGISAAAQVLRDELDELVLSGHI